jgi:ribosomal protein S18 acetylase RimI-like enzyme
MSHTQDVEVQRLQDIWLGDVIRIHRAGLDYTVNSKLGADQLAFLYERMSQDPDCFVGVALVGERPVGIISGTIDEDRLKKRLLMAMPAYRLVWTGWRLMIEPRLIFRWLQSIAIARPVRVGTDEVKAVLTAIAVEAGFQGRGVGGRLVEALEVFLRSRGVRRFRLDTLLHNTSARRFYNRLGFTEVATRAGSVILVRTIA